MDNYITWGGLLAAYGAYVGVSLALSVGTIIAVWLYYWVQERRS